MSVDIGQSYWPQYRKWVITIRSERAGPPITESESTYVLPEAVVRQLAESYAKERPGTATPDSELRRRVEVWLDKVAPRGWRSHPRFEGVQVSRDDLVRLANILRGGP